jgi:hypothetical protein
VRILGKQIGDSAGDDDSLLQIIGKSIGSVTDRQLGASWLI